MNRRDFLKNASSSFLSLGLLNGCQLKSDRAKVLRPNVVWIFLDDCRADAFGCYGSNWARTPHTDTLANSGTVFSNAIVQSPVCVPSRRSMKVGRYVHEIGPMAMGPEPKIPPLYFDQSKAQKLEQGEVLIDAWRDAEIVPTNLGKAHAFQDHFKQLGDEEPLLDHLGRPTPKLMQLYPTSFQTLNRRSIVTDTHKWQIGGVLEVAPEDTETWRLGDRAVEALSEASIYDAPFFLRVSFHAPHVACYVPPSYLVESGAINLPLPSDKELSSRPKLDKKLITYAGATLSLEEISLCRRTYYGMVSLVDQQVGRIVNQLEKMGVLEHTIIAICSDQGFQLGEHGFWKKRAFYEGNVRAPLIMAGPGVPRGRVDAQIEMIDFLPTLQDFCRLEQRNQSSGKSCRDIMLNTSLSGKEYTFSEIDHSMSVYGELRQDSGRRVMVRSQEWKLVGFFDSRVARRDGALYHLADDPGETRNLYHCSKYRKTVLELESVVLDWIRSKTV